MNKYYTPSNEHPEDAIYKVKTFINELQTVQEKYFARLVSDLQLNKTGEEFLFDYIYNSGDEKFDDFCHYLQDFGKKYEDFIVQDMMHNPAVSLLSTVHDAYLHMSSYEADLETAFPSPFEESEQKSYELFASANLSKITSDAL